MASSGKSNNIETSAIFKTNQALAGDGLKNSEIVSSSLNLAKGIMGSGVLSLPNGLALFSGHKNAILPAFSLCMIMGILSGYTYSSIGGICSTYSAKSYEEAWEKSVGPKSSFIISLGITIRCLISCVVFSIIIGDTFSLFLKSFGVPNMLSSRNNIIVLVTTTLLLPLCNLKSLDSLSPFSFVGLMGMVYTAVFMTIRYLDGSYLPGGQFYEIISPNLRPSFDAGAVSINTKLFALVSMLATSYMAHFSAPRFFNNLKSKSMKKFNQIVGIAYGTSIISFMLMLAVGFLTFGKASLGLILNNYAKNDVLATVSRLAIGISMITGYPFIFAAFRDSLLKLLPSNKELISNSTLLTPVLLIVITSIVYNVYDVAELSRLGGAVLGSFLMFIAPAIMNISTCLKSEPSMLAKSTKLAMNTVVLLIGVVTSILGARSMK